MNMNWKERKLLSFISSSLRCHSCPIEMVIPRGATGGGDPRPCISYFGQGHAYKFKTKGMYYLILPIINLPAPPPLSKLLSCTPGDSGPCHTHATGYMVRDLGCEVVREDKLLTFVKSLFIILKYGF